MLNNRLHDYSHELQNARLQPRTSKCTTTATNFKMHDYSTNFKMPADRVEMLLLALHYLFIDLRLVADYTQIPLNHAPVCYSAYSIQHLMVVSVLTYAIAAFSHAPIPRGFLGRWGTYACPVTLSPSEARTWILRPPVILHKRLTTHTMPYFYIMDDAIVDATARGVRLVLR